MPDRAGAAGCSCGGGGAGVAHRGLHVADDRLQFVEEAVEPAGQGAQLVMAAVVEAAGQVAFAAGDVAQHVGQALDRAGHAPCGEGHGDEAEHHGEQAEAQLGERALGALPVEFLLQGDGRAEQRQDDDHDDGDQDEDECIFDQTLTFFTRHVQHCGFSLTELPIYRY